MCEKHFFQSRARKEAVQNHARLPLTSRSKVKGKEAVRLRCEDRSLTVTAQIRETPSHKRSKN